MSCGGTKFVCGIRRYEKHRTNLPDKPTNPGLHNENNKRLEELMAQRSLQDKGVFQNTASNILQPSRSYSGSLSNGQPLVSHGQPLVSHAQPLVSHGQPLVSSNPGSLGPHHSFYQNSQKQYDKERIIDFDTYLAVD
jgi:hypothetical protein